MDNFGYIYILEFIHLLTCITVLNKVSAMTRSDCYIINGGVTVYTCTPDSPDNDPEAVSLWGDVHVLYLPNGRGCRCTELRLCHRLVLGLSLQCNVWVAGLCSAGHQPG